jgi:hypothetical protein
MPSTMHAFNIVIRNHKEDSQRQMMAFANELVRKGRRGPEYTKLLQKQ